MSALGRTGKIPDPRDEPAALRWSLIAISAGFLLVFLVVPLVAVFVQAFSKGWRTYLEALADPVALQAVKLTLLVALIVVPLNTVFGLAAAWAVARFEFRGRRLLVTLIDLPFSVSPVVAGMLFVLLFGAQGLLGKWHQDHGWRILFALPGIVLATLFVTLPFVARQLIPLLEAQGASEEEAALTLGASGFRLFWSVTLPKIRSDGVRAIDAFVRGGGTLVCFNRSALFAIDQFHLPVKNAVGGVKRQDFFTGGSMVSVEVDVAHPLMAGMPDRAPVFVDASPVFETLEGFKGDVLAKYQAAGSPLMSGYLAGEKYMNGKAAALSMPLDRGRVVLVGFRPQWRGQPFGTFRVIFNAVLNVRR